MFITALITQGYDVSYYVTKYVVSYSDDGQEWVYVDSADGTRTEASNNFYFINLLGYNRAANFVQFVRLENAPKRKLS